MNFSENARRWKYLDDGCKWCGSQEWDDDFSDVDHASDCAARILPTMRKTLLLLEWIPAARGGRCCYVCNGMEPSHAPNCKFAALLEKFR